MDSIYRLIWEQMPEDKKKEVIRWLREALDLSNGNFRSILMRLSFKADKENTHKLLSVYPDEITVVQLWKAGFINEDFTISLSLNSERN